MARQPRRRKQPARTRMPKQSTQLVTVHYRRLEDVTGAFGSQTLETTVREAMNYDGGGGKLSAHWKRRAWLVPPGSEDTLLMNLHHDGGNYYFGDLTHYTKGYLQTLLAEAQDAPSLAVEQQPPPKGKEYVHSMMYWLRNRNHLLMILKPIAVLEAFGRISHLAVEGSHDDDHANGPSDSSGQVRRCGSRRRSEGHSGDHSGRNRYRCSGSGSECEAS